KLIKAANANAPKGSAIQAQLANVMIEKVSVREATLGSVLEFVRQTVAKSSGNKVQINFVAMLPQDRMDKQTVTLNLSNIPASEVLRYIGEQANVDFEFDKYAI